MTSARRDGAGRAGRPINRTGAPAPVRRKTTASQGGAQPTARAPLGRATPGRPLPPLDRSPRPHAPTPRPRRRRWRPTLIGMALAQVICVALVLWALTGPTWQVRALRVEFAGVDDPTLRAAIIALPLTGCNIFRCNLQAAESRIAALPGVAAVRLRPRYPDQLIAQVTPRHAAALWRLGPTSDQDIVVASDGVALGAADADPLWTRQPLPIIYDTQSAAFGGHAPAAGARMDALVIKMAGQLRSSTAQPLTQALGPTWTLAYTATQGFVASGAQAHSIIFGTPADAAQAAQPDLRPNDLAATPDATRVVSGVSAQLATLQALTARLTAQSQQAQLIDLRWGTNPYYILAS